MDINYASKQFILYSNEGHTNSQADDRSLCKEIAKDKELLNLCVRNSEEMTPPYFLDAVNQLMDQRDQPLSDNYDRFKDFCFLYQEELEILLQQETNKRRN
ncbi:hypothetical protein [Bacillus sp. FJAT-45037]|uniref:hypothetical protein n=1 Tax=Bacillus sp. FJAT-45037 TaxID=2011007 RepID=UPI000C242113|nr:hypothetical protein [Bacillus sp. FJAT-45037]